MPQLYEICAYSKSTNTRQRELDEDSLKGRHTYDSKTANLKAASFATRLNKQRLLGATDWVADARLITAMG